MLATQTPETPPEAKDVKQIKEKLAQSLKALQKRYVTSDDVVTSEDGDANLLCCALEAVFIHGIKSKYIRSEAGGRTRKGDRGPLPQPFFWSLLKTVTHRDVITELEKISFVGTDVGRCRAWLRLALNHGLLECYLASLFREESQLQAYYQPNALLLDTEERDVLLSYLQGLASLTFNLSYKSAVLNEWTTTPLALSGLCPFLQAETLDLPLNGGDHPTSKSVFKELWDTVSQSSSPDALDAHRGCPVLTGRESSALQGDRTALNSSNLSLDTTGSSQLSSSLSSDSLLQGQDPRSPTAEQWSSSDLDLNINVNISSKRPQKDSLTEFRESGQCSQDSMREDSFVSSTGPDQFSETAIFSGSDSEAPGPSTPSQDFAEQPPDSMLLDSELPPLSFSDENHVNHVPTEEHDDDDDNDAADQLRSEAYVDSFATVRKPEVSVEPAQEVNTHAVKSKEPAREEKEAESADKSSADASGHPGIRRSTSVLSRKLSTDSLPHSHSWISEDDFYKPHLEEVSDQDEAPPAAPTPEPKVSQSPPSVVHRRQIGLSNPFRGLLKLGHLERRGTMGMWRDYYCELSPYEFRLYLNAEERTCSENCSLVRCEGARITSPEGRFELVFPGKRLCLRAANRDEAEDWVDRIIEAVNKCRPASHADEHWEVLQPCSENGVDERTVRAEDADEARMWRVLIRGALDSYLESGEDEEPVAGRAGVTGNLQRLVQHRLKENGVLLVHLNTVPSEKGLDSQNFKCADCSQQIGPSRGRARLCEFSGQYYCDSCHQGDTSIIPSRMVHNWDVTQREVSKKALRLLALVEHEPLLNLEQLNPELVQHAEVMAQIHSLRQRLRLQGDYLLTCRSGAYKKLQERMGQRTYLLESFHLYSVADLRQIAEGQFAAYLMTLSQFATNHVFHCDLCTQRGFICQICHADDTIFPFQFETTTRCKDCKAVFHLVCKAPEHSCPRCQRMKKYRERDLLD